MAPAEVCSTLLQPTQNGPIRPHSTYRLLGHPEEQAMLCTLCTSGVCFAALGACLPHQVCAEDQSMVVGVCAGTTTAIVRRYCGRTHLLVNATRYAA